MSIDYSELPAKYRNEVRAYIDRGIPVADKLLDAVIRNDLAGALCFARKTIGGFGLLDAAVQFFELEAPWECWGSRKEEKEWMAAKAAGRSCGDVKKTKEGP